MASGFLCLTSFINLNSHVSLVVIGQRGGPVADDKITIEMEPQRPQSQDRWSVRGAGRVSEGAGRISEGAGRVSEGAEWASDGAGRASDGAGWALEAAGRVSELVGRGSEHPPITL